MTDYLRETHHEFLAASKEALADPRLQQILGQLGDTLGRRNREAWAALPNSDLIRERARSIKDATLAELGSRHGVHATQIAAWRKQALEHLSEVFDNGNPVLEDAERHIRDLRAKVGELTMESDFLAGALGRGGLPSAKR